jgi:hypothetical protein
MPKPEDFGDARVSRLRELLEAEEEKAGPPQPAGGKGPPLPLIGGAAAAVLLVVLLVFLLLPGGGGSGSGDQVPEGASETSVSVFPSRIPTSVGKNQKVNICGRSGELIAGNVLVVERHTEDQPVIGRLIVLDVIARPEEVGRLSSGKAADLRVVRGSCATSPEAPVTTVTSAPPAPQPTGAPATSPAS